jgi:hypothetical protein
MTIAFFEFFCNFITIQFYRVFGVISLFRRILTLPFVVNAFAMCNVESSIILPRRIDLFTNTSDLVIASLICVLLFSKTKDSHFFNRFYYGFINYLDEFIISYCISIVQRISFTILSIKKIKSRI